MTKLLVSVRNAEEALEAVAGGADLVDIKEPSRGALGAADVRIWHEVAQAVQGRCPVSAALGELIDVECCTQTQGVSLVKAGLARCANVPDWQRRLMQLRDALPTLTRLVAVAYADADAAAAPSPWEVLQAAVSYKLGTLLIDTFDKTSGNLWHALPEVELAALIMSARQHGIRVALAGSLDVACLPRALALAPDWIAVRGAACVGGRQGQVTSQQVAALRRVISGVTEMSDQQLDLARDC